MNETPLEKTDIKMHFKPESWREIFVLSSTAAREVWNNRVAGKGRSYFELKDEDWLAAKPYVTLGQWREAFDNEEPEQLRPVLSRIPGWSAATPVYYCINHQNILKTSWGGFLEYWDGFLSLESDGCFVMAADLPEQKAVFFTSLGEVRAVGFDPIG